MRYQKPKGTVDLLPKDAEKWHYVEETARSIFKQYDFREIRTPIFEHFEVISRGVGETTDIVSKEMYDFYDKGERHVTLRPEGTAPVVRSYVENKLFGPEHSHPFKVFYMGPMFRYERPQSGRLRQFHQIGVEVIGSNQAASDVETIVMALDFFKKLGISHTKLVINSLGSRENRADYRQALIAYLEPFFDQLSSDSQRRLHENPLRVLDSKEEQDQKIVADAPSILEYLDAESEQFFNEVKSLLAELDVTFEVDARMVRGLDYYNHTVFEIMSEAPGFGGVLTTICAGGRYDGLITEFNGPEEFDNAFGFALGVERTLIAIEAENVELPLEPSLDIYVANLDAQANSMSLQTIQLARKHGLTAKCDFLVKSIKANLKSANKMKAKFVILIGESELEKQVVSLKNMETGVEKQVSFTELEQEFKVMGTNNN